MRMAQIGPGHIEREQKHIRAKYGQKIDPVTEEKHKRRNANRLHHGAAQREQDAFHRVRPVHGHRRHRFRGMMHLVERPEHGPAVQ